MNAQKQPWSTNWSVIRLLGQGAQGETFLVREKEPPERTAVLKKLNNNKWREARGRMKMEVSNLEALAYDQIKVPSVFESNVDQFKEDGVPLYFVMEFIEGSTLEDLVSAGEPLSLEAAAAMVFDLASTVAAAHRLGVTHRDLKPTNIIVRKAEAPDLVIVDYGLSFNNVDSINVSLTVPGEQILNEFLALPENNTPGGNRRDPRSDITALCSIFYFCLTGQYTVHLVDARGLPPHRRGGIYSVRHYLSQDHRCSQVEVLFDRGFELRVEHRFQTCEEFVTRLHDVLNTPKDKPEDPRALVAVLAQQLQQREAFLHGECSCG